MVRKRVFAVPFVLTSALAACGGGNPGHTYTNPPEPVQETPPPDEKTPDQTLPDAPTGEGGTVQKRDDGTCWYLSPSPTCPPNTKCNPPPPMQVKCTE